MSTKLYFDDWSPAGVTIQSGRVLFDQNNNSKIAFNKDTAKTYFDDASPELGEWDDVASLDEYIPDSASTNSKGTAFIIAFCMVALSIMLVSI
ncbi:MAG TPA: hypothetical protein VFF33_09135 [Ignavibacteriaceae bacterium]|nr:hypothetical protein [Ignavibacteriaceae bacterium]